MYQLYCKDDLRATFDLECTIFTSVTNLKVYGYLPIGYSPETFDAWTYRRSLLTHRKLLKDYLSRHNINDFRSIVGLTHAVSLNDCFWVKQDTEDLTWKDVSPYTNELDKTIADLSFADDPSDIVLRAQLAKHLTVTAEVATGGQFPKCWIRDDNSVYLLKRGSIFSYARAPYCEVLASQVFSKMHAGIPYKMTTHHDKVASKCKLFTSEELSFVPLSIILHDDHAPFQQVLSYMQTLPMYDMFRRIIICDALTLNTDRHPGNIGVFVDPMSVEIKSCAVGFDYNMSLFPSYPSSTLGDVDKLISNCKPWGVSTSFIDQARYLLTNDIREDLLKLRGITLTLDGYECDEFSKQEVNFCTDIVNCQIDKILYPERQIYYPKVPEVQHANLLRYKQTYTLTDKEFEAFLPSLFKLYKVTNLDDLDAKIGDII